MKRLAFMFPGQGSQAVGMGQELHDTYEEIEQLYKRANDVLEFDIRELMFNGPVETLTETENTQPALLLSSVAAYSLLAKENIQPAMVIGHSLGEYSALVAAGVLSVEDALPLVARRGRLMEAAFPKGKGTMAAVLGLTAKQISEQLSKVSETEVVDIANLNCPGQIVISGSVAGVEEASKLLETAGARRVIPLNVSGPFHSRLMRAANEQYATYLNNVSFSNAETPIFANVSAAPVTESAEIKDLLLKQLYSPVRFEESIENIIAEGIDAIVEVGPGKVLCGLVRKIDRKTKTFSIQDTASLNKFLQWYREDE